VPPEIIRKRFADAVRDEVIEHLVNASVLSALKERGLVPLGRPRVDDLKFEFEAPLSFKVDLEVRPPVVPKDYLGLKVPAGRWSPRRGD
jgi:trigger factor